MKLVFGLKNVSNLALNECLEPLFVTGQSMFMIKEFISKNSTYKSRLQSFCLVLEETLTSWNTIILDIEQKLIASEEGLTLIELAELLLVKLENVEWVVRLLDDYSNANYTHLFNSVVELCEITSHLQNSSLHGMIKNLLVAISVEYFEELEIWLMKGLLSEDSFFMVKQHDSVFQLEKLDQIPTLFHGMCDSILIGGIRAEMSKRLYLQIPLLEAHQAFKSAIKNQDLSKIPISAVVNVCFQSTIVQHTQCVETILYKHVLCNSNLKFHDTFLQIKGFYLLQKRCTINAFMRLLFEKVKIDTLYHLIQP